MLTFKCEFIRRNIEIAFVHVRAYVCVLFDVSDKISNDAFVSIDDYVSGDLKNILRRKPHNYADSVSYSWPRWLSGQITSQDIHDIINAKEKISVGIILIVWIFHIIFWYLAAVYLDNVNPGKFGSAKPWYYLCKVNIKFYN